MLSKLTTGQLRARIIRAGTFAGLSTITEVCKYCDLNARTLNKAIGARVISQSIENTLLLHLPKLDITTSWGELNNESET